MTADIFLTSAFGPARSVDLAKVAERAGYGGVWLAEHHFVRYGQCPSATVLAAAILHATGLPVGTAACVMSARNPVGLAGEAALLSALAPGRLRLGVARGGPGIENELLGGGMAVYENGFPQWLDSLLACRSALGSAAQCSAASPSTAGPPSARSPLPVAAPPMRSPFSVAAQIVPPFQDVPMWVAATSLSTVEIAAARHLPLLLGVEHDADSARLMLDRWSAVAGFESASHARVVLAWPGSRELLRPRLLAWQSLKLPPARAAAHVERLLGSGAIGSTVDDVAAALAADPVPNKLLMVEAAGSFEAAADLISTLANVC